MRLAWRLKGMLSTRHRFGNKQDVEIELYEVLIKSIICVDEAESILASPLQLLWVQVEQRTIWRIFKVSSFETWSTSLHNCWIPWYRRGSRCEWPTWRAHACPHIDIDSWPSVGTGSLCSCLSLSRYICWLSFRKCHVVALNLKCLSCALVVPWYICASKWEREMTS